MPRFAIREHHATGHRFDPRLERGGTREAEEFGEEMLIARLRGNRPDDPHANFRAGGKNWPVHKTKPSGGSGD